MAAKNTPRNSQEYLFQSLNGNMSSLDINWGKNTFLLIGIFFLQLKGPYPPHRQMQVLKPSRYFFLNAETKVSAHTKYLSSTF